MSKKSSIDDLNEQLREMGIEEIRDVESCPERANYLLHLEEGNWNDKDWVKKLKNLEGAYLDNFHKYIAQLYPYLLYEKTNDKVFWNYSKEKGIYEELTFPEVRNFIVGLLMKEGFAAKATEATAKNVLAKYKSAFHMQGKSYDEFDNEKDWFHAANGWLHLPTKKFESHTPERLSRRASAVDYNPEAECPLYDAFLNTESHLPEDAVRVIDQFSGYILQNKRPIKKMLIFHGRPGSGKSMIPEMWCQVLGTMSVSMSLNEIGGDAARFNKDLLVGSTFCFIDEANPKTRDINESFQTLVTKPDFLVERKGIQDKVTIENVVRFVLCLNEMPDHMPPGMERRYRYINFPRSFRDEGIEDESVYNTIREKELSGILNRMLKGYDDFTKMGNLTSISSEEDHKRDYSISADDFSAFLNEHFEPTKDDEVRYSYKQMHEAFMAEFPKAYNKQLSTQAFNKKLFSNRLPEFSKIGKGRNKERTARGYIGIKLKAGHEFSQYEKEAIKSPDSVEKDW